MAWAGRLRLPPGREPVLIQARLGSDSLFRECPRVKESTGRLLVITGALGGHRRRPGRRLPQARVRGRRHLALDHPASDEGILTVPGDIADPAVADRVIAAAIDASAASNTHGLPDSAFRRPTAPERVLCPA